MENYSIQYLPLAAQDLNNIIEYIMIDNPLSATKILEKFDKSITKLSNYPFIGTIPRDLTIATLQYRFIVIETYLVFYVVYEDNEIVEIRRIFNQKQKYDTLL